MPELSPLTPCQEKAFDILQREGNVFLTGAAGTGKSFLLDRYLRGKSPEDFPILASTGAAAILIGGRTFHSFFGLGILEGGADAAITRALRNKRVTRRLQHACCVIIDEISMLSGTTLKVAETIARHARSQNTPWGGLRIIAVGDFAQLPPITSNQQEKDWAFLHPVWQESAFQPALLSTVMRTQDVEFLEILNFIREGIVNDRVENFLEARTVFTAEEVKATRLYPRRVQAEQENLRRLESISRELHTFETQYIGDERYKESTKKALPIPEKLFLKEDALIMMRKNDTSGEMRWVNGSLGHIRYIGEDTLTIKLLAGETIHIGKEKFSSLDGDGKEVMEAWNFPITLAWATTIHKAQGASLDRMIVDVERLWEPGQAYVALSRVRSGDGLCIERWSAASIRAEPLVTDFYNTLAEKTLHYVPRPLFVPPKTKHQKKNKTRPLSMGKQRLHIARDLLAAKADIVSIAESCGVAAGTVFKYIEKLITQGTVPDLTYLIEDIDGEQGIRALYREYGLTHMKPVFDALEASVSYDDLCLVRLAMLAEEKRKEKMGVA